MSQFILMMPQDRLTPRRLTAAAFLDREVLSTSDSRQKITPEVWLIDLADPATHVAGAERILNAVERQRSDRFRKEIDRFRFTQARAWLRIVLGSMLRIDATAVVLQHGRNGKPRLSPQQEASPAGHRICVHFNVAHSAGLIVLAFDPKHEVGIDIEFMQELPDLESVSRQVLPSDLLAEWFRLEPLQKSQLFYWHWTRREAGLKAVGCGLAADPPSNWESQMKFCELDLPSGYVGTVAIRTGVSM